MATNTAASFSTPTANGTAGPFNIGFTYLAQSEIDVTVDGVLKTLNTHYIFHSTTQISFTSGNFPSAGQAIKFQRNTDLSAKKVDFQNGSVLTEADLDSNSDQVLFGLQEFVDEINNNVIKRDGTQTITNNLVFEGSSDDANETTLGVVNPTADRTINLPNVSGTVVTTGDTGTVTTDMIGDDQVTPAKIGNADLKSLSNCQTGSAASLANLTNNEVAILDGATVSTTELNTLDGVNSTLTASELNTLDGITASTANLNQLTGKEVETSVTGNSNAKIPTSKAVNDLVLAVTNALGGFVAIANATSFPTSHPDPSENAGTVVSITDANGIVVNSSGVATISNGAGSSTVTINGFPTDLRSKTLGSGIGLQVQTTTTLHTYDYHKALIREIDLLNFSADVDSFRSRYRVVSTTPTSDNDEGDIIYRTSDDKLLIYNGTAFQDPLIGNFHINTLSSYNGTGGNTATFNGSAYRFNINHAPEQAQQLLVSINGVIQKPNSGTSQPSEGFALNGDSIIFGAAPASGSDFFIITIGKSVNIGVVSDGTIDDAKVASDASIEGTKINPNFGSQNISTTGTLETGDITISTTAPLIKFDESDQTTDYFIVANNNTLTLARNNLNTPNHIQKWNADGHVDFLTNVDFASGIDVTGEITGTSHIDLPDDGTLKLGDNDEFQIFHNSSNGNSIIKETGGGILSLQTNGSQTSFWDSTNQVLMAEFNTGGSCTFRHGANTRLATSSTGIDVTGDINGTGDLILTADTPKIRLIDNNADDDFQISNFSGNFIIKDITNNVDRFTIASDGTTTVANNLNVGSGIDVTGSITIPDATITNGIPNNAIKIGDATDGDLMIYHDSNNSVIRDAGTGSLIFQSNQIVGYRYGTSEKLFQFDQGGAASLFYGGASTAKLATTATGITVDGRIGVGTASASFPVHVFNDDTETNNQVRIEQDGTGDAVLGFALTGTRAYSLGIDNSDSDKFKISTATNLHTNTLFTIDGANQRVGINQASPSYQLDLVGTQRNTVSAADTEILILNANMGTSNNRAFLVKAPETDSGVAPFRIQTGNALEVQIDQQKTLNINSSGQINLHHAGANTPKLKTIADGVKVHGNIGIGTDTPNRSLHIVSNGTSKIALTDSDITAETNSLVGGIDFTTTDTQNAGISAHIGAYHQDDQGNAYLRFDTGNASNVTERMRITATGDLVSIGDGTFDDIRIGEHSNPDFGGIFHKDQSGNEYMMISKDQHTFISASSGYGVSIVGGNNNFANNIQVHPTSGINITAANNVKILDGILDFSAASSSPYIQMKAVSQRVKYLLWNHISFGIGMTSGVSYGSIGNNQNDNTQFAATFQMNDINDRGWIFLDSGHTLAQGAMSLTTQGRMTVAHSIRLGYGESDTTESGATHALDVSGSISSTSTISATTSAAIGDTNLRKITTSTSAPTSSDGGVGDIWIVYPS